MSEENKAKIRRILEETMNKGNLDVVDEEIAPGYLYHSGTESHGRDALKMLITTYRAAFPDMVVTIEDQIAEGDKVVTRFTARATHQGDLMGIAPTGKAIEAETIVIARLEGSKVVEEWEIMDRLGMMQQLGVVPSQ